MENEPKMNKFKNYKSLVLILVIIAVIVGLYLHYAQRNTPTKATSTQTTSSAEHTASYISSVISAIASYRQSTQEATLVAKEYTDKGVDINNRSVKTAEELAVLMKVVNDFKNGNSYLAPYLNDSNSLISVSAKALDQSATSILQPNEDMLAAFQTGDTQKEQIALASVTAAQDSGTNDMNNVMQIIREGLIMGLGENDNLPTSGTIHTSLSVEQRNNLLAQIKSDFPNGVNNYSNDIYSLMIYGIQAVLVSDTFEQFRSLAGTMTTNGAQALPFVVSEK
ncbi:MAG: hypothetical protein WAN50_05230 [Minisyncoccia bacterium]